MDTVKIEDFKVWLNSKKGTAQKRLDKFLENFKTDPVYAFEWADDSMEAAQTLRLCNLVFTFIDNDPTDLVIYTKEYLEREVRNYSRWVEASTSSSSNYIRRMYLKVCADLLEDLKYF